jgi:hypothetical protein
MILTFYTALFTENIFTSNKDIYKFNKLSSSLIVEENIGLNS